MRAHQPRHPSPGDGLRFGFCEMCGGLIHGIEGTWYHAGHLTYPDGRTAPASAIEPDRDHAAVGPPSSRRARARRGLAVAAMLAVAIVGTILMEDVVSSPWGARALESISTTVLVVGAGLSLLWSIRRVVRRIWSRVSGGARLRPRRVEGKRRAH